MLWSQLYGVVERVTVSVPEPGVAEIYYGCCAQDDPQKRCRQDDLRWSHYLGAHNWTQSVETSVLQFSWSTYCCCSRGREHNPPLRKRHSSRTWNPVLSVKSLDKTASRPYDRSGQPIFYASVAL